MPVGFGRGARTSRARSAYPTTTMATTMNMSLHQHPHRCQDCPAERWVSLRAAVTAPSWERMGGCIPSVIRAMANSARGTKEVGEPTAWAEIYGQTVVSTTPMHRGHGTSCVCKSRERFDVVGGGREEVAAAWHIIMAPTNHRRRCA